MRNMLFGILEGSTAKVYRVSQRADTNLMAAYFLLDLEEYQLIKGGYPEDVSLVRQAGLTSQLPDDPDTVGKIIYRNDGQRAILYAVGQNAKDDGGYKDDRGSDKKRDDIIYWQRNLKEDIGQYGCFRLVFGCSLRRRTDKINEIAFLRRFVGEIQHGQTSCPFYGIPRVR